MNRDEAPGGSKASLPSTGDTQGGPSAMVIAMAPQSVNQHSEAVLRDDLLIRQNLKSAAKSTRKIAMSLNGCPAEAPILPPRVEGAFGMLKTRKLLWNAKAVAMVQGGNDGKESELRFQAVNDSTTVHQPITPGPVVREGPSFEQLANVLAASPETAAQDLQWILVDSGRLPIQHQTQASNFMKSQQLQEWLESAESRSLFVQADSFRDGAISAVSLVSRLVIQTMQAREGVLSAFYACGLHTDHHRDVHPNAQGLRNASLDALGALFEGLLYQLPQWAVVLLVVDEVSFYETEEKAQGMCDAMSKMIEVVGEARCLVKLLATSSGMSRYVRTGFPQEDVVWITAHGCLTLAGPQR
ncbi:MAG: hypothetical protein Q9221_007963 [Calogaya cf. arnoldii]